MPPEAGRGGRFAARFRALAGHGEGAFMPFLVLGDGGAGLCRDMIDVLVEAGADALELGLPNARPWADGPAITRAHKRALTAGITMGDCWRLIAEVRARHPTLPVCLQGYAAALTGRGGTQAFLGACHDTDVDAVLILGQGGTSVPCIADLATDLAPAPVVLVPPGGAAAALPAGAAFIYLVSRAGPTGTAHPMGRPDPARVAALKRQAGVPVLLGFGVSGPADIRTALAAGVDGIIVGSSLARRIETGARAPDRGLGAVAAWARTMKRATRHAVNLPGR